MLIYFIVISITTLFTFFAQKTYERSKFLFLFISLIVLFIPSFIAGVRDNTIGTDIYVYEYDRFFAAKNYHSLIDYCINTPEELFFLLINYFASCFSDNLGVGLFFIEFIFLLFAYIAFVRMRNYAPMWIMMLLFMLGYYNLSFNLMRQMIAMSFLLFAVTFLIRENNVKLFCVLLVLSVFFHKTAIIGGIFFLYINWALNSKPKTRKVLTIIYILGCIGIYALFKILLSILAKLGGRFEAYVAYGGDPSTGVKWSSTVFTILLLGDIILIFFAMLCFYKKVKDYRSTYILAMLSIVDLMSEKLGGYTAYASRLSCYFCAPYVMLLPHLMIQEQLVSERTKFILKIMLIVGFSTIWLRMIGSTGQTIPYTSQFLGIN